MNDDIVKKAKKNIIWGILNKAVLMICPFVTRTMVRFFLGAQFLGLDSLFTSVISVLSLTELGLSSAIVYHLYRPIATGNVSLVNAILNFYRKAYRIIGIVIFLIGIALIPYLEFLIHGDYPNKITLWKVYLVFLLNTVASFFLYAYMTPLITAHQREDINSNINSAITIMMTIAKLLVLFVSRNYYFYIILMPVFTIISNIWLALRVKSLFPQYTCDGAIPKDMHDGLRKLVFGTFIQKSCALSRNSLDSICVSAFLGLYMTAMYNNYFWISTAVSALVGTISISFAGGIGKHVAIKTVDDNYEELKKLDFIYLWIGGWCTICMICLYQPFMQLWMGKDMLFDKKTVLLFCVYFYLLKLGDIRSLYSAANGLFWKMKWRSLIETLLNILLNILLGKIYGVNGIIVATIISLMVCNWVWSTRILFKEYFSLQRIKDFYLRQIFYSSITIIVAIIIIGVCNIFMYNNIFQELVVKALICVTLPNAIFWVIYHRTRTYKDSIAYLSGIGNKNILE